MEVETAVASKPARRLATAMDVMMAYKTHTDVNIVSSEKKKVELPLTQKRHPL
jgi:hypothetical protein